MSEDYDEAKGEGASARADLYDQFLLQEIIDEKKLTFDQASRCLNSLGKDESGIRYAYLMITATDQKLTDVSVVLNFKHVLFLDFSGNYLDLEALQVLTEMPFLILLKAERNRIKSAALGAMPYLQILDFNRNQITETEDIYQPLLDTLELNHNLIYYVKFVAQNLGTLMQLELRGNQLIDVSGTYPTSVQKLYLPANRIVKTGGDTLNSLSNLVLLHLRDNKIRKLNGFSAALDKLSYLNLRNNKINKLRQFRKLKGLTNLETLIITGNPVAGGTGGEAGEGDDDDDADEDAFGEEEEKKDVVRIGLLVLLPQLKRINKMPVTPEERDEAFFVRDEKMEEIMEQSSSEEEDENATTTEITTDFTTETEKASANNSEGEDP